MKVSPIVSEMHLKLENFEWRWEPWIVVLVFEFVLERNEFPIIKVKKYFKIKFFYWKNKRTWLRSYRQSRHEDQAHAKGNAPYQQIKADLKYPTRGQI